jgi:predicted secreted Zn-dependent protease
LITVPWLLAATIVSSAPPPVSNPAAPPTDHEAFPSPVVHVRYDYYPVNGSTVAALQEQMNEFGPLSELEQRHYIADVTWHVRWTYDYAMTDRGCAVTAAEGDVEITFRLPWWNVPSGTSGSVVAAWNQFLGALQVHENGHMAHGVAAANKVIQTLKTLPAYASCQELVTTANAATREIIQFYNQQDIAYDHVTQHGLTQGAIFPPLQPSASQE